MAPTLSKFSLVYKDCQSGKTWEQFQSLREDFNSNRRLFYVLFTDNFKLQSSQLSSRFSETFQDRAKPIQLNSNYTSDRNSYDWDNRGVSNYLEVSQILDYSESHRDTLVVLTNSTRTSEVDPKDFLTHVRVWSQKRGFEGVQIWVDEVDKNIKMFKDLIPALDTSPHVDRIVGMTGTGLQEIFNNLGTSELNLLPVKPPVATFRGFESHTYNHIDFDSSAENLKSMKGGGHDLCISYAYKVLSEVEIPENTTWFVPASVTTDSHRNMMTLLLAMGFEVVVVVNGEEKTFYYLSSEAPTTSFKERMLTDPASVWGDVVPHIRRRELFDDPLGSLEEALATRASQYNWDYMKVALTGNRCINRGTTIQSEHFHFTHAIFPPTLVFANVSAQLTDIKKADDYYQWMARANGDTGAWMRDRKLQVWCTREARSWIQNYSIIPQTLAVNTPGKLTSETYGRLLGTLGCLTTQVSQLCNPEIVEEHKRQAERQARAEEQANMWLWANIEILYLEEMPVEATKQDIELAIKRALKSGGAPDKISDEGRYKLEAYHRNGKKRGKRAAGQSEAPRTTFLARPEILPYVKNPDAKFWSFNSGTCIGIDEPIIKMQSDQTYNHAMNVNRARMGSLEKEKRIRVALEAAAAENTPESVVAVYPTYKVRDSQLVLAPVIRAIWAKSQ